MARHRSPNDHRDHAKHTPASRPAPHREGAHRIAAPPAALHGRIMVAAVAVGALVAASQTVQLPAAVAADATPSPRLASDTTDTTPLADSLSVDRVSSGPSFEPEVLPAKADAAALDIRALGKAAKLAAENATPKPGEPYLVGDNSGLDGWIAQSLGMLGLPQALAPGVKQIIMQESGGNPRAINLTDSNARAGHPSQGLMQLVPQTFRTYVLPALRDRPITDPVANITAGLRYMIQNYGVATVTAGGRRGSGGGYVGY